MSQIDINTSQNVNIKFKLASIGERILAFGIDMLVKIAMGAGIFFIFIKLFGGGDYLSRIDKFSAMALFVLLTLPLHIYTLVSESMMQGQTLGKKAVKIRVVKIDGYQASFMDYFTRWIFRMVDVFISSGVIGLVAIISSKNNQRLGGMASGTAVISLKERVNISHTILAEIQEGYQPQFPQVVALSDNDMRIIKDNFQKSRAADDQAVIAAISKKIKSTLKIENLPKNMTDRQFITKIIQDYSYFTGKE